jgi:hypothetical protein
VSALRAATRGSSESFGKFMKTPTLIVRLVGLYLLTTCSIGLLQLKKAQAMVGQFGGTQNQMIADIGVYLWLGLLVGLGATIFAGPLARLLTFDSDPREKSLDLSDQFLRR